eukprot:tig00000113_g5666.t1
MSGEVSIYYASGWATVHAHYCVGGSWTAPPGRRMDAVFDGRLHSCAVGLSQVGQIEVCFNDGSNNWDSCGGNNYKIDAVPGRRYLVSGGSVRPVPEAQLPFLLVSDLDGTMVAHEDGEPALRAFGELFCGELAPAGCLLAYSTGRSPSSFAALLASTPLLRPHALVLGVGTQIYARDGAQWALDRAWEQRISAGGWSRSLAEEVCRVFPELKPQPESEQSALKLSFHAPADAAPRLVAAMGAALGARGVPARVIASGSGGSRYIDVIPAAAGKYHAMLYLREKLGFAADRTLVAGDSGNDADMFTGDEFGVAVGNSHAELVDMVRGRGRPHRHLIASGRAADGIREAIRHFKLQAPAAA